MTYSINYTGLVKLKNKANSRFGGSSRFKVYDDEFVDTSEEKKIKTKGTEFKLNFEESKSELSEKTKKKKSYRLNKSKIKKKCHAFSRLKKSREFLAFYTITFPMNLEDEICYKVFNTWLTRCRRNCDLKSYLWVAERQEKKSKTIHFHMLTNDYMEIRKANDFMLAALKTEKKRGNENLKDVNIEKYNGIDVRPVRENRKALINYLAKYISKNDIEFYRLPWHCSRDISRLFTSVNLEESEEDEYFDLLPKELEKYTKILEEEYFNATGFKFSPNDDVFKNIDEMNELVYNM